MQRREIGEAPFSVALRKIHRMKAPGLLEAIRVRLRLDPVYSGAPGGWSSGSSVPETSEVERDLRFLHLREREAVELRDSGEKVRGDVAALHAMVGRLPPLYHEHLGEPDAERRSAGELAVTCAWIADKDDAKTLFHAARWRDEVLPDLIRMDRNLSWSWRAWASVRGLFLKHPVEDWVQRHARDLSKQAKRSLHWGYENEHRNTRTVIDAWRRLPSDADPTEHAVEIMRDVFRNGPAVRRDILALRTVQSLAVLDVRNYRDLVFRIGDFASDGEDPELGRALP